MRMALALTSVVAPLVDRVFLFILQSPGGTRFGYSFTFGGFLVPTMTLDAATGLVLEAPDLTRYESVCDDDGFLDTDVTALPADANPIGDAPDGTTYRLTINNDGFYLPIAL